MKIFDNLSLFFNLLRNMGGQYVLFRIKYTIFSKIGITSLKFPTKVVNKVFFSLKDWKKSKSKFFFDSKETLNFPRETNSILENEFKNIKNGYFVFFNSEPICLGLNYDWITNPISNYKYNIEDHWSKIDDYSKNAGDIKFLWEKSKFSYLYQIIRYDYHFEKDQSEFVFSEILSWINANPINRGPNWKCSQEISIRILNWTFALHYFKNSSYLTDEIFQIIMTSLYWQTKHIYKNINFSRIAVRNNHAISETMGLFIIGQLYPLFPEAKKWKKDGKRWFEEEIDFQLFNDGTYLQYSMIYNRVIIQMLTWALYIAKANKEVFSKVVYTKTKETLNFLLMSQDSKSGWLPNYGANDGSLYFKVNNCNFRDFRPQLDALYYYFNDSHLYKETETWEDSFWFAGTVNFNVSPVNLKPKVTSFKDGGYFIINEGNIKTFIRCGNHLYRPSQADNLHIDIWVEGENILRDAGTYSYNADKKMELFFNGTLSHNTIMLGFNDQMKKGPRFIWYDWSQKIESIIEESDIFYLFKGKINAFRQVGKDIFHERVIKKYKNQLHWEIIDTVTHDSGLPIVQIWNPSPFFFENYTIECLDEGNNIIMPIFKKSWYSSTYSSIEEALQINFISNEKLIKTIIKIKN